MERWHREDDGVVMCIIGPRLDKGYARHVDEATVGSDAGAWRWLHRAPLEATPHALSAPPP